MNILEFWIEKFSLIFEIIKEAGFKYILIILSCRTISTFMDLLSIGFAVNYFLSTTIVVNLQCEIKFDLSSVTFISQRCVFFPICIGFAVA